MVQARKESTLEKKDKTFLIKDHDSLSGKMFKSFPSQRVQRCEYKQSHINHGLGSAKGMTLSQDTDCLIPKLPTRKDIPC